MRENKLNNMASWAQENESEVTNLGKPFMVDEATDTHDVKYSEIVCCNCRACDSDISLLKISNKYASRECQCAKHMQRTYLDAVFTGNFDLLEVCCEKDVNIHACDSYGESALHMASGRCDLKMLSFLLNLKPPLNVNAKNSNGMTPLAAAAAGTHDQCAKLLLEHGADPNISDKNGKTPLFFSVGSGNTRITNMLIKNGADVNAVDTFGSTPLSTAVVEKPLVHMIRVLLSSGANPISNNNRLNPFLEAVLDCTNYEKLEIIKLLLDYGADVNVLDERSKRNCLHLTGINGFLPLAEYLVNYGADLEQLDMANRNPHQVATDHNNYEVADFFLKAMWLRRASHKVAMIKKYGKKRKFTIAEIFEK